MPYVEGVEAYKEFEYRRSVIKPENPYPVNSEDYNEWNRGWQAESDSHDASIRYEQHIRHEGRFSSY